MPIAIGDAESGALTLLPPAPLPPVVVAAPLPPAVAPAPLAPSLGPSGSSDFGARGLPQVDVGAVGPIVSPTAVPEPAPPATAAPGEPLPPSSGAPSGSGDFGARGLPQEGVGAVGPIVEPHGKPSPSDGGTTTTTTSGGGTSGGATRTLDSAFTKTKGDPKDSRPEATSAWLYFQEFFGTELPHFVAQVNTLRLSLPKVLH